MNLEELKAQRAKLDEQIAAAEKAAQYPWSAGPWRNSHDLLIKEVNGREIAEVHDVDDVAQANFRLIAAAPELYQMLELVVSEHKEGAEALNLRIRDDSTIGQAEKLLEKVRGE